MEFFYVISRTFFDGNLRKRSIFACFRTFLNIFGQNEWHFCFSQPILHFFPKSDFDQWSTPLKSNILYPFAVTLYLRHYYINFVLSDSPSPTHTHTLEHLFVDLLNS